MTFSKFTKFATITKMELLWKDLFPFAITVYSYSQAQGPTNQLSVLMDLSLLEILYKWCMLYLIFCFWLLLQSILFFRFIHFVVCFIPFYCQIIFQYILCGHATFCIYLFIINTYNKYIVCIYLFISLWAFWLFPLFDYYE